MKFYSPATRGFYAEDIHGARGSEGCKIPSDAVEVTDEEHAALIAGEGPEKVIQVGANGRPELADRVYTDDELAAAARMRRNALLDAADKAINVLEDAAADAGAWRKYRASLRDLPGQKGFPRAVKWPATP